MSPIPQPLQEVLSLQRLVVIEVGGQVAGDAEMVQEPAGVTGILGGDEVRLLQNPHRPEGHILQVPDGGGDDVQYSSRQFYFPQSRE